VWLVVGLVNHAIGSDRAMLAEWIAKPEVALALAAFLVAGFWHTKLGLQVIAEDYIHSKGLAFATLLFSSAACLVLGAMALLAVAHLNFFGI
jgi:succinate dehydrogenase / fumarate reductase membrane anchor subunit